MSRQRCVLVTRLVTMRTEAIMATVMLTYGQLGRNAESAQEALIRLESELKGWSRLAG
jgi:hypothetical protein